MRRTLRRSCAACARAKHACDLQTPKCSRCVERSSICSYANEPLGTGNGQALRRPLNPRTSPPAISYPSRHENRELVACVPVEGSPNKPILPVIEAHFLDPFNTYPQTNLPRARIQQLIHHFLSKIVYQYYPWDTNPQTNPFVTSWWQLALSDPALFHVSLQTASWDDELHAQKGFVSSEILMRDSVSLVRRKVQDPALAFQDATLNAVVTLAAIEHGKGNLDVSKQHIEGVKRMVKVRGGIPAIKSSNPLTARMVSWVAMLVTGLPQFPPADDLEIADGSIQWIRITNIDPPQNDDLVDLDGNSLVLSVKNVLSRLQTVFGQLHTPHLSDTATILSVPDWQDLASFTIHQLLWPISLDGGLESNEVSEAVRYGLCIYMFILHGPTYYSHTSILQGLNLRLQHYIEILLTSGNLQGSLSTWLLTVGMVASIGTANHAWFVTQASTLSKLSRLYIWKDVKVHLETVLWIDDDSFAAFSSQVWGSILAYPAPVSLVGNVGTRTTYPWCSLSRSLVPSGKGQ